MNLPLQGQLRLSFTVPGEPVGKGRPRATVITDRDGNPKKDPRTGRWMIRFYTPKRTREFEAAVTQYAVVAMAHQRWRRRLEAPMRLSIVAVFKRPNDGKAKGAKLPPGHVGRCSDPDLSNVLKAVEDGLNAARVWADDNQVVEYGEMRKVYGAAGEPAHTEIIVEIVT